MKNIINNQFLFFSFLTILGVGAILLFTLIYMKRKNLRLFKAEEESLLDDLKELETEPEVKITQIVEEAKEEKPKANLEEVLEKMQADLDKKEDVVAIFEQEQEEKAIISYQELLKSKNKNATGANKELVSVIEQIAAPKPEIPEPNFVEPVSFTEEKDEYIPSYIYPYYDITESIDEDIKSPIVESIPEDDDFFLNKKEDKKKFKTTDFISPIYGKVDNHIEYPRIRSFSEKNTMTEINSNNIELDKKIDLFDENSSNQSDAFLNALKEFRSHLE